MKKKNGMQFTTEMRLPKNSEISEYLDDFSRLYNCAYRYALRERCSGRFVQKHESQGEFTKHIMRKFCFLERTANSIVRAVEGRYKTLEETARYELGRLQSERAHLKKEIERIKTKVDLYKSFAGTGALSEEEVKDYRDLRTKLHWKHVKLDRTVSKINKTKKALKTGKFTMVQGSKRLFKAKDHLEKSGYSSHQAWLKVFREKRDCNIEYTGRNSETMGNLMCQLTPGREFGRFDLKVRKEKLYCQEGRRKDKYIIVKNLKLSFLVEELTTQLNEALDKALKTRSLFIRFHKRGGRGWYIQITLEMEKTEPVTDVGNGAIGIDLNSAFLEAVTVDRNGEFLEKRHIGLNAHAKGRKGLDEVRKETKRIISQALEEKRPVVIEDLSFTKKKRSHRKGNYSKRFNKIIHDLDYRRIGESIERCAQKNRVMVLTVDPAYSSRIAKELYLDRKEFDSVHEAAAFVIARRGLGIREGLYGF